MSTSYELLVADTTTKLTTSSEFAQVLSEVAQLRQFVPSVRVQDDGSHALANEVMVRVKKAAKRLEEMRQQAKAPFLQFGKSVDNVFRPLENTCKEMVGMLDGQMLPYAIQKRNAEEEARREAAIAAQQVTDGPVSPQPKIAVAAVESDSGKTSLVTRKRFTVVDVYKLAKAAMDSRTKVEMGVIQVNERRVQELVDAGIYSEKEWAKYGVKVFEETKQRTVAK